MSLKDLSARESAFTAQRHPFLERALSRYGQVADSLEDVMKRTTRQVAPILIDALESLSSPELQEIATEYTHGSGVVHVLPRCFPNHMNDVRRHPLLALADQLSKLIPLGYPVDHPMEGHPEALRRFGAPDGTLKLYNLPILPEVDKYKEQAETSEMFAAHNDGLGYAGLISNSIIALDSAPLWGGFTYFQNLVQIAPVLAKDDPEAFEALFLPDAITALRPRGKGAIKVIGPVLFLGRDGEAQCFFRIDSGEYVMSWRNHPALNRARVILHELCAPYGPSSQFVHLMRAGELVLINNKHVVHGRTRFIDPATDQGRVLARKWFVAKPQDAIYRHVPGLAIHSDFARLFPDMFQGDAISGEWHFDASLEQNVRIDQ
ncbi:MAG TPA: TauD/TfdA family dioxygenase [Streptosporangiaceae bacterium]|nr:TauD/TfdA family dioxygenase [Streptosporangiaceae bacterium]